MNRSNSNWIALTFTLFILMGAFAQVSAETYTVKFRVVDANGDPVADAELATHWIVKASRLYCLPRTVG